MNKCCLSVVFISLFSLGPLAAEQPAPIPAADVIETLTAIQNETTLSAGTDRQTVITALRKYALPQYVFQTPVKAATLDETVADLESDPNPPVVSSIHDRVFVQQDETIYSHGQFDSTITVNGAKQEIKNQRFWSIFVLTGGSWKLLHAGIENPPPPAAK